MVRDTIPLVLQQGENDVLCPPISPMLDAASVMLRDPAGKADFRIVLQKFRGSALTEQAALSHFEGQTLPFQIRGEGKTREVAGKIIRAGYWRQANGSLDRESEPIVVLDGRFVFGLPGSTVGRYRRPR